MHGVRQCEKKGNTKQINDCATVLRSTYTYVMKPLSANDRPGRSAEVKMDPCGAVSRVWRSFADCRRRASVGSFVSTEYSN